MNQLEHLVRVADVLTEYNRIRTAQGFRGVSRQWFRSLLKREGVSLYGGIDGLTLYMEHAAAQRMYEYAQRPPQKVEY